MDFFESEVNSFGESLRDDLLKAARAQTLRYSNFLLTLSTNVRPINTTEKDELVEWLVKVTEELFSSFDSVNGNLLKPAGTRNYLKEVFPEDNKIISVNARISVEHGNAQRGQIHAHVLLEVAHEYLKQEDNAEGYGEDTGRANLGVHVNVEALRDWLNARIPQMNIEDDRKPEKVYVNCKLLTKGTDNSNKWLTLQYINKDVARDNDGGQRNLRVDEVNTNDPDLSRVRHNMLRGGVNGTLEDHSLTKEQILVGGALDEDDPFRAPKMVKTTVTAPKMVKTTAAAPKFVVTSGAKKSMKKFGKKN